LVAFGPIVAERIPTLEDLIGNHIEILERMFADDHLDSLRSQVPAHPAVRTYDYLSAAAENRFRWEDAREIARAILTMTIDGATWARPPTSSDFWSLIEDTRARDLVRSRIWNPEAFGDVVAELFYLGWLKTEGFDAELVEREGLPDIRVRTDRRNLWAEVKRVRIGTKASSIRKKLAKANQQIKNADPKGAGIVFVSLARPDGASGSDEVPGDMQRYVDEVERQLASGYTRSIAQAIVTFDDWLEPTERPGAKVFFSRRRSIVVNHPTPRLKLDLPDGAMNVGLTAAVASRHQP